MDKKTLEGIVVGVVAGALVFGGFSAAFAASPGAVGAAIDAASKTPALVRPYLLGPLGVLAKLTGLDVESIITQRRSGKSLADIAKSKGVSVDKLVDDVIAARKAALDVRVQQGVITQEQEDQLLNLMRERMKQRFQSSAQGGPCLGGWGGRGRGLGSSGGGGGPAVGFGRMMGGSATQQ